MHEEQVRAYYNGSVDYEWRRLVQDAYHRLEYETTMHFLTKHLPKGGAVLDAGGGPGRYTVALAKAGYRVSLLDLAPANLLRARRAARRGGVESRVATISEGSIVDLSRFRDGTFDAVLCLGGPLSHVLGARERMRAVSELVRVCKAGAPLFVSVIGRLGVLVFDLTAGQREISMPHFVQLRDSGDYAGGHGFTACHFFLPEELRELFGDVGVDILELAGLEGIGSHHAVETDALARSRTRWKIWMETHYKTCTHPAVVGMSEHMLLVARKRRVAVARANRNPSV